MKRQVLAALVLVCSLTATAAQSRMILVARDGSGEFIVLQEALDAAASGDTLLLGPGEYTEMFPVQYIGYPWPVDVVGDINADQLTIIGSGSDQTTIGQVATEVDTGHYTPNALMWAGGGYFRLEGVTIRNSFNGLDSSASGVLYIQDCVFENNVAAMNWRNIGWGGYVKNCRFFTNHRTFNAQIYLTGSGGGAVIEDCDVGSSPLDVSILMNFVDAITIRNCDIHDGRLGIQIGGGASCAVEGSRIFDIEKYGLNITPVGARLDVVDSEVSGGQLAIYAYSESVFTATGSVFTGGTLGVFYLFNQNPAMVHYCDLINTGSPYSVECLQYPSAGTIDHDFRGNYWGTEDGSQIASWIYDGLDDPAQTAEVLYTPFATGDSDLVIALNPNDPEIIIPETGGSFLYDASIENNTGIDIVADLTIEAVLPDGTAYPVMTLPGVTLAGASVRTRINIVQEVPGAAPAGTYTYRVSASLGDTLLVDEAELPFEKLGGGVVAAGAMSWPVTGWLEEDRPPFQGGAVKPVLYGPVPNPFNPTTTVTFELPAQNAVSLYVFDLQGRLVRTLLRDQVCPQGRQEAVWDGRDESGRQAASGTYFFRLEAGGQVETKRGVLVK